MLQFIKQDTHACIQNSDLKTKQKTFENFEYMYMRFSLVKTCLHCECPLFCRKLGVYCERLFFQTPFKTLFNNITQSRNSTLVKAFKDAGTTFLKNNIAYSNQ